MIGISYVCVMVSGRRKSEIYDDFDMDRKERLNLYRRIFEEEEGKIFKGALKAPSGKTGNESSIGIILFNSPENSVQNILARMPEFHENFIRRIYQEG